MEKEILTAKEEVPPFSSSGRGKGKRPGGSAQRRQDTFRQKKNADTTAAHTHALKERLGILDDQGPSSLETIVKYRANGVSTVAVPLSITTRGVGFATAIVFDRLVTSFEGKPPEVPLSIQQMYRVYLSAVHYKMYLSGAATTEVPSYMPAVDISPSAARAMEHVKVLPNVMSMVLYCVGRVEMPTATYFGCYAQPPNTTEALVEYRATTINPDNIRELLRLAARGNEAKRRRLRELWSIPGARFSDDNVLVTVFRS